jgi:hypothetical protein
MNAGRPAIANREGRFALPIAIHMSARGGMRIKLSLAYWAAARS